VSYMIRNGAGELLFERVRSLPIVDYHCHLSPAEIFEDKPFENIGQVWLGGDHYKWRLMRTAGIDERFITGDSSWHDKFINYAKALEFAAGHPLYHWSHMELSRWFGIDKVLCPETAQEIWERANECIKRERLSPRKLLALSNTECLCTTDDIIDDLSVHAAIKDDEDLKVRVLPSFRYDNLLLIRRAGYADYLKKLYEASGIKVTDLASLKAAAASRLEFFVSRGCRFSDVGIPVFPTRIADDATADGIIRSVLSGSTVTAEEESAFIGNMFLFLGGLFKKHGIVMQWHLAPLRNANSRLFGKLGADCGCDCVGDPVSGSALAAMLDAIESESGLPETVLYTLNPSSSEQMASIAGAFRGVRCGAAWWFCDHKRGIREQLEIFAENATLGAFPGMLTDSRSFLSYVRHEYFRRILCDLVGEWVEKGEYEMNSAIKLVQNLSYYNTVKMVGEPK